MAKNFSKPGFTFFGQLVFLLSLALILSRWLAYNQEPRRRCDCAECRTRLLNDGSTTLQQVIGARKIDSLSSGALVTTKARVMQGHTTAAKIQALGRSVIFVTVTLDNLDFLENWFASVSAQGFGPRVLFIAEDRGAYEYLAQAHPDQTVYHGDVVLEEEEGGGDAVKKSKLSDRTPYYLLYLLSLNLSSVLHNDLDSVWLSNPFVHFGESSDYDALLTDDSAMYRGISLSPRNELPARPVPYRKPHPSFKGAVYQFSDSFIFARPTAASIRLVRAWMRLVAEKKDQSSQISLNVAATELRGAVKIGSLSQKRFPSGGLLLDRFPSLQAYQEKTGVLPAVVHNNYATGHDQERKRFEKFGLWHVDNGHKLYKWIAQHKGNSRTRT